MIELHTPAGLAISFDVLISDYPDGGGICVRLRLRPMDINNQHEAGLSFAIGRVLPTGDVLEITENIGLRRSCLPLDAASAATWSMPQGQFFLRPDWNSRPWILQSLQATGAIARVPGGMQLRDARVAHQLSSSVQIDEDQRLRPVA